MYNNNIDWNKTRNKKAPTEVFSIEFWHNVKYERHENQVKHSLAKKKTKKQQQQQKTLTNKH